MKHLESFNNYTINESAIEKVLGENPKDEMSKKIKSVYQTVKDNPILNKLSKLTPVLYVDYLNLYAKLDSKLNPQVKTVLSEVGLDPKSVKSFLDKFGLSK